MALSLSLQQDGTMAFPEMVHFHPATLGDATEVVWSRSSHVPCVHSRILQLWLIDVFIFLKCGEDSLTAHHYGQQGPFSGRL